MESPKTITVAEAAKLLGSYPSFVRLGLQQRVFPFGFAVKRKKWAYIIYEDKLIGWLNSNSGELQRTS